jgi:maltose-binding protein MalE
MGPDLLIAPARWAQALVEAGVIQPLSEQTVDTSIYLPTLVDHLHYQDKLYALPLSAHTYALYYNKTMVAEPPTTLTDLLNRAGGGHPVALETTFYGAFWGIQASGGQFDPRERVILDEKSVADWLTWLTRAQANPNIILSRDEELLYTLFREGQVAYYVGGSDRLLALQQALGPEAVGVAPLPGSLNNPAGPFLQAEALMFNTASTPAQTAVALELARFLTNEAQQTKLARQAGRIPANALVRIDPRVFPAVAGFIDQTKTAVPLPLTPSGGQALVQGDLTYVQTLEGILEPADAAQILVNQFNNSLLNPPAGGESDAE